MKANANTTSMTTEQDVMSCPACHCVIKAICVVVADFGTPTLKQGGEVDIPVTGSLATFSLRHDCNGAVRTDDGYPAEEMGL